MNYINNDTKEALIKELKFKTTRSSGSGGQNVNKVSTKVILIFDIQNSFVLNVEQKELLYKNFPTKINKQNEFQMSSSKDRSQLMNKNNVIERFFEMLEHAFTPEIERKATKPSYASKLKTQKIKKLQAEKKQQRKKIEWNKE